MQKAYVEKIRKETAAKNIRYNRYLMLRYFLAMFFFSNLLWLITLVMAGGISFSPLAILPAGLMVLNALAFAEHVKLYRHKGDITSAQLRFNMALHHGQLVVNGGLIIISAIGLGFNQILPMFLNSGQSRLFAGGLMSLGAIMAMACIIRIRKIIKNQDKYHKRIKELGIEF